MNFNTPKTYENRRCYKCQSTLYTSAIIKFNRFNNTKFNIQKPSISFKKQLLPFLIQKAVCYSGKLTVLNKQTKLHKHTE